MTQTAAAHIITADAVALGDPEIIIMGRVEDGEGDRVIARYPHAGHLPGRWTVGSILDLNGWRPVGDRTDVETGYFILDVERA